MITYLTPQTTPWFTKPTQNQHSGHWHITAATADYFGIIEQDTYAEFPADINEPHRARRRLYYAGKIKTNWARRGDESDIFHPNGLTFSAGNDLHITNGEKSAIIHYQAGFAATISSMKGETSKSAKAAIIDAVLLMPTQPQRIHVYLDNDAAGYRAGDQWHTHRDRLQAAGVELITYDLGAWCARQRIPGKNWDTRDIYEHVQHDTARYAAILAALPIYKPVKPVEAYAAKPLPIALDSDLSQPINIIAHALHSHDPRAKQTDEWLNCQCPNPAHDDKRASFGFNLTTGAGNCFGCGETPNLKTLAGWLGIEANGDFWGQGGKSTGKTSHRRITSEPDAIPTWLDAYRDRVTVINRQYLSAAVVPASVSAIHSPLGSNKTGIIGEQSAQVQTALMIVPTEALSHAAYARLQAEGYQHYQDLKNQNLPLWDAPKLVICQNSLPQLIHPKTQMLPSYEAIFVDESDQILERFMDKTFKGAEGINAETVLQQLVKQAANVWLLDATMSALTVDWLIALRGDAVKILHNAYRPTPKPIYAYETKEDIIAQAYAAIDAEAYPVAIVCDTRKRTKTLAEDVRQVLAAKYLASGVNAADAAQQADSDVLEIHGDNNSTQRARAALADINTAVSAAKVVVMNTAVGSGVSIEIPVKAVYAVFDGTTAHPLALKQLLGRFRHSEALHLWISDREQHQPTNAETIYNQKLDDRAWLGKTFGLNFQFDSDGKLAYNDHQRDFLRLWAAIAAKYNRLTNNARITLYDALSDVGTITHIEAYTSEDANRQQEEIRDRLTHARQSIKKNEIKKVCTVAAVDEAQYQKLDRQNSITPEILAGYARWDIEQHYHTEIDEQLAEFDLHQGGRGKLSWFMNVHTALDQLHERDAYDHASGEAIHTHRDRKAITAVMLWTFRTFYPDGLHDVELDHFDETLLRWWDAYQAYGYDRVLYAGKPPRDKRKIEDEHGNAIYIDLSDREKALTRLKLIHRKAGINLKRWRKRGDTPDGYGIDPARLAYMYGLKGLQDAYIAELDRLINSACVTNLHQKELYKTCKLVTPAVSDGMPRPAVTICEIASTMRKLVTQKLLQNLTELTEQGRGVLDYTAEQLQLALAWEAQRFAQANVGDGD